jgi:outer membrane receptor protein involved in Fe transport
MDRSNRGRPVRPRAGGSAWALCLICSTALAQGNGVITGVVKDASTQAPLANVLVTATSPALIGEQIVLTDGVGEYRVPQLPPGTYSVRFEREDHKPHSRQGIEVQPGYTLRFNAELIPEVAGATTIAVVGKPPLIDVGSTQQTSVVDRDFIQNIPVAPPYSLGGNNRSFETLALTVPTARQDTYGVSLKGATSPENSYLIDGLSIRNTSLGYSASKLSVEFVESVTVDTGGYLPEFGRTTGGIIAANTRSGGNEFRGSIWGTWTPSGLSGEPHSVPGQNSVISFRIQPHNIVDFGVSLGGYLIKDRLWFFIGVQPEFSRYRVYQDLKPYKVDADGNQVLDAAGNPQAEDTIYTRPFFADEHQIQYFGKLTYLVNDDHRLSLTITGTPSYSGGTNVFASSATQPGTPAVRAFLGQPGVVFIKALNATFDVVGKLSSSFAEKRLLLDVTAGWHHEDHNSESIDGSKLGSTDPGALVNQPRVNWAARPITDYIDLPPDVAANCLSDQHGGAQRCPTGFSTGGPGILAVNRYDSVQGRAVLTMLFQGGGHHVLKLGVDGEVDTSSLVRGVSGGQIVNEHQRAGGQLWNGRHWGYLVAPDTAQDFTPNSTSKGVFLGGFVQDSWSILDRITLNAGVRYDAQTLYGSDGVVALSFPNEWSPRVGLIWDPTQAGRSKIYASYARYYENVPLDVADRAFGQDVNILARYLPATGDCNPRNTITTSCVTPDRRIDFFVPPNSTYRVGIYPVRTSVDPSIKPASQDEVVAGIEYEVLPNTRASVAYTHRQIVDWVEDLSTTNGGIYLIGNPGSGAASNLPVPRRVYNAVAVSLEKTFADLWLAQLSYSYQKLNGNIEGLYRQQTGQLDPNFNADFDLWPFLANRQGPLPGDIRHTVKAYLAKAFVLSPTWSVTLGTAYTGASGPPIDFAGLNSFYQTAEVMIFPRGSAGRLGWVHSIDVNGAVTLRFSSAIALTLSVNVFNLFNFQQVTAVDNVYSWDVGVLPVPNGNPATDRGKIVNDIDGQRLKAEEVNKNFLRPVDYQPVRQIRFQARMSF